MKKLSKNPIDQYFRENLESPDLEYNKQDWKGLEKMLPKHKTRKSLVWWLPASVAAAVALLFISLWLNKPVSTTDEIVQNKVKVSEADKISPAEGKSTDMSDALLGNKHSSTTSKTSTSTNRNLHQKVFSTELVTLIVPRPGDDANVSETINSDPAIPSISLSDVLDLQHHENLYADNVDLSDYNVLVTPAPHQKTNSESPDENRGSRFSLGLSLSPDINSISNFSESSVGNSAGLALSYRISPRLSVNTAIAYSKKVYSAEPYQYKAPWAYSSAGKYAESIDADCRVLDVPLNLSYNILESPKRTVFASAGMSSYFMLKEKYTIIVGSSPSGYPSYPSPSYAYSNKNQHLLSVLNLSAGISKPVSKQTSLVVEPYMRLPVTGIGQGKVHLKSIGLNLQFRYHFKKSGLTKTNPEGDAQ